MPNKDYKPKALRVRYAITFSQYWRKITPFSDIFCFAKMVDKKISLIMKNVILHTFLKSSHATRLYLIYQPIKEKNEIWNTIDLFHVIFPKQEKLQEVLKKFLRNLQSFKRYHQLMQRTFSFIIKMLDHVFIGRCHCATRIICMLKWEFLVY